MSLIGEIRKRSGTVVAPAVGVFALVYVVHHAVDGERGIHGWRVLNERVAELRIEALTAEKARDRWARQVRLVHPESADTDMLDEYARRLLNVGKPNEIVILTDARADARAVPAR